MLSPKSTLASDIMIALTIRISIVATKNQALKSLEVHDLRTLWPLPPQEVFGGWAERASRRSSKLIG